MMGVEDYFLQVHPSVAEGGFCFTGGRREEPFHFRGVVDQAHSPTPSARRCLDHHWITVDICNGFCIGNGVHDPVATGYRGKPTLLHAVSYTHLRAHETDSYLVCRLLLEQKKNTQK